MKDLNSKSKGIYIPSFFCMKIDSLSYDEMMSDREISLFVHEYIHYLQNITTTYGLERLNYDFAILCKMVDWIKERDNVDVYVPLSEDILSELTKSNKKIKDLTWGESVDIDDFTFVSVEVFDKEEIDEQRIVETIGINYKNKAGIEGLCSFGAREIYESMAYLIEQHITKNYELSPDYPYKVAIMVVDYIYPELLNDYRNLLILFDKALMSSNPGAELYSIVQWLKQINYSGSNPTNLFLFLDHYWELSDMGERISCHKYFINRAEEVRNNLHAILNDKYFIDYHTWVDRIIDYVIYLRTNKPLFWLDLVEYGYIKNNPIWSEIINNAGSPLIETIKHEYFYVNPIGFDSSSLVYFKVFNQIYKLFVMGDTKCDLMPWCNDTRNAVNVDRTCFNCPWNHPDYNWQLCTFRGIWQHWGLSKYIINVK